MTFRGERCTLTDGNPSLREGLLPQKRIVANQLAKRMFSHADGKNSTRADDNARQRQRAGSHRQRHSPAAAQARAAQARAARARVRSLAETEDRTFFRFCMTHAVLADAASPGRTPSGSDRKRPAASDLARAACGLWLLARKRAHGSDALLTGTATASWKLAFRWYVCARARPPTSPRERSRARMRARAHASTRARKHAHSHAHMCIRPHVRTQALMHARTPCRTCSRSTP